MEQRNTTQNCSIEDGSRNVRASNSLDLLHATKKNVQDLKMTDVVQKKRSSKEASQRQLLTAKQMTKYIKRNEPVYLALIRPNPVQRSQGMTQKIKWDQMKQSGLVQKAPPVVETRKKICSVAPSNVQNELNSLLEEF